MRLLLLPLLVIVLAACSSPMRWWRVGNCVVVYDDREVSRQFVVAGEHCDVKRVEMPVSFGAAR
jgi:hypothetical protein